MRHLLPVLLAAPVAVTALAAEWRARNSRTLSEQPAEAPDDAPLVSVVIPARNEARNIARCVESALASRYSRLEVIVVDDHSTDDTGAIVQAIAARDPRLRVVVPAPLPSDWFGKQWACAAGARAARGSIIGFMDADTWQTPDLLPRLVNLMRQRGSDMATVGGTQELGSFWERIIQPQVFAMMFVRYGGTEVVNASRRVENKIANGQCLFFTRDAYDAVGGHASVRGKVAEDLALAQRSFRLGRRTTFVLGLEQLFTRMYTSLAELRAGWGKNIVAGGRDAMPFGLVGQLLYPIVLLAPSVVGFAPPIILLLALVVAVPPDVVLWAALVEAVNHFWWLRAYLFLGMSPLYALLHPLGSLMLFGISLGAIVRGRRVRWKGREYRAA